MKFAANLLSGLWFGTEESYHAVLDAVEKLSVLEAQGPEALKAAILARGGGGGNDPFGLPPIWENQGGVAVIDVTGPMINGSAGFLRIFGVIGYEDIRGALLEASKDDGVKAILMSIDSGGGQVNGVEDTGNLMLQVDKVKPLVSYTGGTMASAAYWLGSSAREVFGAKTSTVGSVGTLMMHIERSKQLAEDGITATVIRHGKFKALANPVEPLSADGKAQLQAIVDDAGEVFVEYVSGRRGVTAAEFQKKMGEGRVFPGRTAADIGLIDGVMSAEEVMAHVKSLDKSKTPAHNPRNIGRGSNMKATLSKKTLLAIAAGTALDALGLDAPEANSEGVKLEGEALAALQTEATEVKAAFDAAITAAVDTAKKESEEKLTAAQEAVTKAQADLTAAQGELTIAKAAANDLNGKLTASAELAGKQAEIVKASCSSMSVALGGSADLAAALTGNELLAEHERLAAEFTKKFPAGGVAAVITKPEPKKTVASNPLFNHLASTFNK